MQVELRGKSDRLGGIQAHFGSGFANGGDRAGCKLQEPDGKGSLLTVSQESIVPNGMDAVNRDAVRFAHCRKTTPTMGENLVEFDLFRRKVESRMHPGGFAARLCFRNASLSRLDESLVPASTDGQSGAAGIAQQVRRLFGPMGDGGKSDVLFAGGESKEEMATESWGNFDSRTAYRKAQDDLGRERKEGVTRRPRRGEERLNSKYPKSGRRDRCYLRENKSRLLPRRPRRGRLSTGAAPSLSAARASHRPPFPTISLDGQKLPT